MSMHLYSVVLLSGLAHACSTSDVYYNVSTVFEAKIYGKPIGTSNVRSLLECTKLCSKTTPCRSAMFDTDEKLCSTNRLTMDIATMVSCKPGDTCLASSVRKYAQRYVKTTMRQPCLHDHDCVDTKSECRRGACSCVPGYSYNHTTYSCVTGCTLYGTMFQFKHGKQLDGNNDHSYIAPSFEHCADTCIAATSYVCRSIEYYPNRTTTNCYLSSITAVTRPDVYLDQSDGDLYTRDCL